MPKYKLNIRGLLFISGLQKLSVVHSNIKKLSRAKNGTFGMDYLVESSSMNLNLYMAMK